MNNRPYLLAAVLLLATVAGMPAAQAEPRPCLQIHIEEVLADLGTSPPQPRQAVCIPDQVPIPDTTPIDVALGIVFGAVEEDTPDEDPTLPPCTENNVIDLVFDCAEQGGAYVFLLAEWAGTLPNDWILRLDDEWSDQMNAYMFAESQAQRVHLEGEAAKAFGFEGDAQEAYDAYREAERAKAAAYAATTRDEAVAYATYAVLLSVAYGDAVAANANGNAYENSHEAATWSDEAASALANYVFESFSYAVCLVFGEVGTCVEATFEDPGTPTPFFEQPPLPPDVPVWVPGTPETPADPPVVTPETPEAPPTPSDDVPLPLPPPPPMPGDEQQDP